MTAGTAGDARADPRLPAFAGFAAMLAAAGLPIYIHAPKFFVDTYGVGLSGLGAVLVALRLIDVVQDPALGWLAGHLRRRALGAFCGILVLSGAMVCLFAVPAPIAPLAWFAIVLTALFSAYSWLTILFYAAGVRAGNALGPGGHIRIATWREAGALGGVCLAAVLPTVLGVTKAPFAGFAALFAVASLAAGRAMRTEWQPPPPPGPAPFAAILADRLSRRLLLIALVNAAPLAVTSTLFLFYVESRLSAPGWEGPLLLLFFLSAAVSTPVWGRMARRRGAKPALLAGMVLAVLSFGWAATLGAGDVAAFALVCIASGAALGADLTLLPALFSARLATLELGASAAFGLWAFVSKLSLAVAAATVLPALDAAGFVGPESPEAALTLLTVLYAVLPCGLKLVAIALLAFTRTESV